jgi:hypothetical protein
MAATVISLSDHRSKKLAGAVKKSCYIFLHPKTFSDCGDKRFEVMGFPLEKKMDPWAKEDEGHIFLHGKYLGTYKVINGAAHL